MTTQQQVMYDFDRHIDAACALAVKYGINADYGEDRFRQGIADVGRAAKLKPAETGARVGLGGSTVYADGNRKIETPALNDAELPERVVNILLQSPRPLTAAQVAVRIHRDPQRIETLLKSLSRDIVSIVPDTNPKAYEMRNDIVGYSQPYPTDLQALKDRRRRAADVVEGLARDERRSFTMTAKMIEPQSDGLYAYIREYSNKLPSERRLDALVAETRVRGSVPDESSFRALLLFSPDRGERDAVDHYRSCDDLYCDPRYEMIPFRHPLDELAITQFLTEHFDAVIDEVSELLTAYRSNNAAAPSYRMSFICC